MSPSPDEVLLALFMSLVDGFGRGNVYISTTIDHSLLTALSALGMSHHVLQQITVYLSALIPYQISSPSIIWMKFPLDKHLHEVAINFVSNFCKPARSKTFIHSGGYYWFIDFCEIYSYILFNNTFNFFMIGLGALLSNDGLLDTLFLCIMYAANNVFRY